jgi:hypothetical protein
MRIWTLHPKYLDTKGLLAAWREGLLAKKVLEGNTKGYRNHPQLERFKKSENRINMINRYLSEIFMESRRRQFNFDASKYEFSGICDNSKIDVTRGQVIYEFELLKRKLEMRNMEKFSEIRDVQDIEVNAIFNIIQGGIEPWEKTARPNPDQE